MPADPHNRPLLIVNPVSGSARTGREFPSMLSAIEAALGDVDIVYTAHRGHARDLARRGVEEGHGLIIAVGGDGTFSEVANGVLRAPSMPAPPVQVGLIATGTGGDLRRSLGIEHRLDAYLAALASGRERHMDVGRVVFTDERGDSVDQYFVNVLSAGMGGLVDRYVEQRPPLVGGRAAYYLASLRALAVCRRRPIALRVTPSGEAAPGDATERRVNAWVIAICNGSWFGAGMHVCPPALLDDGRLDVVIVTVPTKREFLMKLPTVYRGEHLEIEGVEYLTCSRVELELASPEETADRGRTDGAAPMTARTSQPCLLDVDGEALGRLPATIEVVPGALTLRA
jgi:diacylglycerol kinase (ATP)